MHHIVTRHNQLSHFTLVVRLFTFSRLVPCFSILSYFSIQLFQTFIPWYFTRPESMRKSLVSTTKPFSDSDCVLMHKSVHAQRLQKRSSALQKTVIPEESSPCFSSLSPPGRGGSDGFSSSGLQLLFMTSDGSWVTYCD